MPEPYVWSFDLAWSVHPRCGAPHRQLGNLLVALWNDDSPEPFEHGTPVSDLMVGRLQVLDGAPVDWDQTRSLGEQ